MILLALSIAGVIFLCWFGNYTAAMYRRMYGSLPAVYMESEPTRFEAQSSFYETDGGCSAVTMMSSCVVTPYRFPR